MGKFFLREAIPSDVDLIYTWANDPVVRKNSFHSEYISYKNHIEWFEKVIMDEKILQYILMENEIPIGQIRLTVEGNIAEIGYSIAADYRGKGYGHTILQLVVTEIKKNHPEIKTLVARVKPENAISLALFLGEGYEPYYLCFKKKL